VVARELELTAARVQVAAHPVPEVGALEPGRHADPVEQREPFGWAQVLRHSHGAVERVQHGWSRLFEQLVVAQQAIAGNAREPSRRTLGEAFPGPAVHRCQERSLGCILDGLELAHADPAREHRDEPDVLIPKKAGIERQAHPALRITAI